MKILVLETHSYTSKAGKPGFVSSCIRLRTTNHGEKLETFDVFGLDTTRAGDLVDVEFNPNGFVDSFDIIGSSETLDLFVQELR